MRDDGPPPYLRREVSFVSIAFGGRYNSHFARGLNTNSLNSKLSSGKILIEGLPLWFKRGGKEHDRALWAMQGV